MRYLLTLLLLLSATPSYALDVIPGLKGFGTTTRAAYGAANPPEICIVNSLATTTGNPTWDSAYGPNNIGVFTGTLNQCVEGLDTLAGETIDGHVVSANSGKIVLFATSGTITETGTNGAYDPYRYNVESYTSIHGETAPSPGVTLRNISLYSSGTNDILLKHIRCRMDGPPSLPYGGHKCFTLAASGTDDMYNIVLDHVSAAWGGDVNAGLFTETSGMYQDFTISNSIFTEPRNDIGLIDEDTPTEDVPRNVLWGKADVSKTSPTNGFFYGNLMMDSDYRNPVFQGASGVVANNVMFNNKNSNFTCAGNVGIVECVAVGNVVITGNQSESGASFVIETGTSVTQWLDSGGISITDHAAYMYDNVVDGVTQTGADDLSFFRVRSGHATLYALQPTYTGVVVTGNDPPNNSPVWPTGFVADASTVTKANVLANAGAYPAYRDALDTRSVAYAQAETGVAVMEQGAPTAGDWAEIALATNATTLAIPANPHSDSGNGYTNLEIWLHEQAAIADGTSEAASTSLGSGTTSRGAGTTTFN